MFLRQAGADLSVDIENATIAHGNVGDGPVVREGAEITWQYTVENTSNVARDAPTVTDDVPGAVQNVDRDGERSILGDDLDDNDDTIGGEGVTT